ncbi:MAG: hypothetical protein JZU65_21705, partial [Chlorobium sp.]|nr:hypothetical protein [Chlorobium sp.]
MKNLYENSDLYLEKISEFGREKSMLEFNNTLAYVDSQNELIPASYSMKKVEETFENDNNLVGAIIINEAKNQLVGMISRKSFM